MRHSKEGLLSKVWADEQDTSAGKLTREDGQSQWKGKEPEYVEDSISPSSASSAVQKVMKGSRSKRLPLLTNWNAVFSSARLPHSRPQGAPHIAPDPKLRYVTPSRVSSRKSFKDSRLASSPSLPSPLADRPTVGALAPRSRNPVSPEVAPGTTSSSSSLS
jgi:hypothetical protein